MGGDPGLHAEAPGSLVQQTRRLGWLSHPLVVLASHVITVVSLVWGFFSFYASREKPELTYYVIPVRTAILRSGQISRLTTTFDGRPVVGDISAAQIAIWNDGTKAIQSDEILTPILINVGEERPILEATIRTKSRDVIGATLATEQQANGRLGVSWRILEPKDGLLVQVTYIGRPDANLTVSGALKGQPRVERAKVFESKAEDGTILPMSSLTSKVLIQICAGVLLGLGIYMCVLAFRYTPDPKLGTRNARLAGKATTIAVALLAFAIGAWLTIAIASASSGPAFQLQ